MPMRRFAEPGPKVYWAVTGQVTFGSGEADMTNGLDSIQEALDAVARGDLVVVVDDEDRENEGDLVMAACKATRETVAFMVRHTSGILCVPMLPEEARRLDLDPMVSENDAPLGTAFTVSVDYRFGLTTGISAEERCNTIRALANPNAGAEDFVRPGHVFPLVARDGGVLMRSGHTEAAVDLSRLAGLPASGLIAELVNDDGTVQRGAQVLAFARAHGLKAVSIADLIEYRQQRERLVERVAEFPVQTEIGPARGIAFTTPFDAMQHLALVFGEIGDGREVPTRMHREEILDDVFGRRTTLTEVYRHFKETGRGVLVYLREGHPGVPSPGLESEAREADAPTNSDADRAQRWRDIGLGAQILRDLGVTSIRLLATRTRQYVGLGGFGIEIVDTDIIAP